MVMVPKELRYTEEHEWMSWEGDVATIGITDFAQDQLGDIVFVELPAVGDRVTYLEPFGTIEAVKTVSDLYASVSGEVIAINERLENEPELVNQDPYGEGWMIKVRMSNPAEIDQLLSAADYQRLIQGH